MIYILSSSCTNKYLYLFVQLASYSFIMNRKIRNMQNANNKNKAQKFKSHSTAMKCVPWQI